MELTDVILSRRSIRSFTEKEIPSDILEKVLEAGRVAPSSQNKQCWRFVVVQNEEIRKKLAFKSGFIGKVNFFIKNAPVIIVACADPSRSVHLNEQDYYLVDTAIAFQQMILTAWNYGIGSCWLAAFNEKKVKEILQIPDKIRIVTLSPFGYPKERPSLYDKALKTFAGSKKRLPLEKIVCYDKWEL
ncbi:MAG: nitroreductase family protein [Candidatus Cloacimonetes bacterium]|nr:nitroreductase family protein [Candidatus Cloacimonadota bacterium]